ncbi:uncharacterized protein OCT59_016974 [Rhizophagus irregularis]|uniref:Uncharacterized protein n=1 Tax=Rhizophagus irregularis (strain DAOM 197198w) TaxID=1432141 RepID=A0A015LFK7_RHIIW|nr:hypothetical protein RirG_242360 [Rhizophagus irregularis DAOM 197198w]PKY30691.1 hypothetical protein RhiirB3_447902 [Rhizophagus irregularis]UZO24679.1 hypothetical protein OCT59_016974 [Rhizophagus irregularis]
MNIDNYNDEINLNDPTIIFDDNNSYSYIANKSDEFENDDDFQLMMALSTKKRKQKSEIGMIFTIMSLQNVFLISMQNQMDL